jgi:hypothetical protein
MKRLLLLLAAGGVLMCADLNDVRSVYVLPMSHNLDQYLANRLTNDHVFTVVTDPKLADAVLTDRVGSSLETKLETMLPAPKPEKVKEKVKEDKDGKEPDSLAESISKSSGGPDTSSIGRSKGTVFLVDTKSRQVVWSSYDLPKDTSSKELDRTASDIVSRIKKDLNPGKKK